MKKYRLIIALFLSLFTLCTSLDASGQDLPEFQIMTEDWIPYQYEENNQLKGIAVDLLVLMLDRAGSSQGRQAIKLYPWARGYSILQSRENTILFSTTRIPERENLFKWVGPIFQNATFLIAKKSKRIMGPCKRC